MDTAEVWNQVNLSEEAVRLIAPSFTEFFRFEVEVTRAMRQWTQMPAVTQLFTQQVALASRVLDVQTRAWYQMQPAVAAAMKISAQLQQHQVDAVGQVLTSLRKLEAMNPQAVSAVFDALPETVDGPASAPDLVDIWRAELVDFLARAKSPAVERGAAVLFVFFAWWWISMVSGRFDVAEKVDEGFMILVAYLVGTYHHPRSR